MNAFTFSDLHGGACIGITEGALSNLSRRQLEGCRRPRVRSCAVGRLRHGDHGPACCLACTAASRDSIGDEVVAGNSPVLLLGLLAPLVQAASAVTNAALSRQREWEADAAAVRYTRDPLSLAQALQMMVRSPGGVGCIPDGMSALCIRPANPSATGFFARAMATHPPVDDRITRLLNTAHVGWDAFLKQDAEAEAVLAQREHTSQAPEPGDVAAVDRLAQMVAAPIVAAPVAAATPVAAASAASAAPLLPAPLVAGSGAAAQPSRPSGEGGVGRCPSCDASLERFDYEGTDVVICRSCGGRLASTSQVQRILTRREMRFDERQLALAAAVIENGDELRRQNHRRRLSGQIATIACPRCGRPMMRRLYSYDYAIEVDYCSMCDLFWFDRDELEALQAIVERQSP